MMVYLDDEPTCGYGPADNPCGAPVELLVETGRASFGCCQEHLICMAGKDDEVSKATFHADGRLITIPKKSPGDIRERAGDVWSRIIAPQPEER